LTVFNALLRIIGIISLFVYLAVIVSLFEVDPEFAGLMAIVLLLLGLGSFIPAMFPGRLGERSTRAFGALGFFIGIGGLYGAYRLATEDMITKPEMETPVMLLTILFFLVGICGLLLFLKWIVIGSTRD